MSSNFSNEVHDPVANLTIRPVRSILKSSKSMDESRLEYNQESMSKRNNYPTIGMKRSESKSQKIPHFDEMNIIATYHPVNKDYGHMKIEEPKTPYAPNDNIEEEMDIDLSHDKIARTGFDPDTLVQRLNESSGSCQSQIDRKSRKSVDENVTISSEALENRKRFEKHRKQHYNEFEVVRLHKKEIEAELQALEKEETTASEGIESESISMSALNDSIKPVLVYHDDSNSTSTFSHHVHVEDNNQYDADKDVLTPEERERRKQFAMKRKKHYNEFHVAHSNDDDNEK